MYNFGKNNTDTLIMLFHSLVQDQCKQKCTTFTPANFIPMFYFRSLIHCVDWTKLLGDLKDNVVRYEYTVVTLI